MCFMNTFDPNMTHAMPALSSIDDDPEDTQILPATPTRPLVAIQEGLKSSFSPLSGALALNVIGRATHPLILMRDQELPEKDMPLAFALVCMVAALVVFLTEWGFTDLLSSFVWR
jgi:hypothetical protein